MPKNQPELKLISLEDVAVEPVRWLWYPYIPLGKLSIIHGDPAEGKTTLALWIAAACSRGQALPGGETGEPLTILYQTAEDGLGDTIKPRLLESKADLQKIYTIDETDFPLSMLDHRIGEAIEKTHAQLMILDPMQAYLGEKVDMNRANEVRTVMKGLTKVANQTGCAIVLVGHLNKSQSANSAQRGLGSMDFRAAARSVLLVGRLKSMGKFVLGISRSAAASNIFINACNEFQFLENVGGRTRKPTGKKKASADKEPLDEQELNKALCGILEEQTDKDELYASELKGILLRLRPDFNEKSYGCTTFLKLLDKLSKQFGALHIRSDNFNVMVSLAQSSKESAPEMNKENWRALIREQLARYKEDGFERINPSILKADIQASFPGFSEKALGFKRFSDMLKAMEKEGLITVELDDQKNMLIKVS